MIPVRMKRTVKGKDKIKELEKKYKKKENLEKILKTSIGNSLHQLDLDNWKYFEKHPDKELNEGTTIFIEDISFNSSDFELLHIIKNNKTSSLNDLALKMSKEVSTVQKKIKKLEKAELVSLKKGKKNCKIPVVNYDSIEIPI
ncbi:HVO_A0114 family putative DNA-binding protein [Methanobrevibacter curvatus]|uniref:MarR family protein n=1 Tax=Methanobrevibacter curvatus TaxID=49547 RepID=A0A162FCP4_9EURY|nr:MarR family transcriptional regulator [Methanobrevibacter curvatus]KZX11075.1 MarR family protein [Methanobrevibacter curvatus]